MRLSNKNLEQPDSSKSRFFFAGFTVMIKKLQKLDINF